MDAMQGDLGDFALELLERADRRFAIDLTQAAAAHMHSAVTVALMAVALPRGWPCTTQQELWECAQCLDAERGDDECHLVWRFSALWKFRSHAEHRDIEDWDLENSRPMARRFVTEVVGMAAG